MLSRRNTLVMVVAIIVAIATFAVVRIVTSEAENREREANAEATQPEVAEYLLEDGKTTEVLVDLGSVKPSSLSHYDFKLKNTTNTPITLLDYEATCRCVWLELPQKAIRQNESATLRLTFDSRGEWGSIGNYIAIKSSEDDIAVAVWMSAEVE